MATVQGIKPGSVELVKNIVSSPPKSFFFHPLDLNIGERLKLR